MSIRYLKRFRMLLDCRRQELPRGRLPAGFSWVPWEEALDGAHAAVNYDCFREELDAAIFRTFSSLDGCRRLLRDLSRHSGFLPQATWLIKSPDEDFQPGMLCATVQSLRQDTQQGSIQNIGVLARFRGLGLGRALLLKAISGFRSAGLSRIYLEVTAANTRAIALYRSLGFEIVGTKYRELLPPADLPPRFRQQLELVSETRDEAAGTV